MPKFVFEDRKTREKVQEVEMTSEELEQEHNNDLTQLFSKYDAQLHTVEYNF